MGAEVIAIYDSDEQIRSQTTPKLLAWLLYHYIPKSEEWISVPNEDDPAGENWTPKRTDISEAISEIERFLASPEAQHMTVHGFALEDLIGEFQ